MTRSALIVGALIGCGPRAAVPTTRAAGDEITLYRDRAVIKQRVEIDVVGERATMTFELPAGVHLEDIAVVDRGTLTLVELSEPAALPTPKAGTGPTVMQLIVAAPRKGKHAVDLAYVTDRLKWDAAYTMTTTAARDRVTLRGAIAIRNTTGIVLKAHASVIDSELAPWRGRIAEQLGSSLAGTTNSTTPIATPRLLGPVALGAGETRVELLSNEPPRARKRVGCTRSALWRSDSGARTH